MENDNPVKNFSKGQRTKLELVLGFSVGVKYIMMDEPFLGNDPFARNDFLKIMAGLIDIAKEIFGIDDNRVVSLFLNEN